MNNISLNSYQALPPVRFGLNQAAPGNPLNPNQQQLESQAGGRETGDQFQFSDEALALARAASPLAPSQQNIVHPMPDPGPDHPAGIVALAPSANLNVAPELQIVHPMPDPGPDDPDPEAI